MPDRPAFHRFEHFKGKIITLTHCYRSNAHAFGHLRGEIAKGNARGRNFSDWRTSHREHEFSDLFTSERTSVGADEYRVMGALSTAQRVVSRRCAQPQTWNRPQTSRARTGQDRYAFGSFCAKGCETSFGVGREYVGQNAPQFLRTRTLSGRGRAFGALCGGLRGVGKSAPHQSSVSQHLLDVRSQFLHSARRACSRRETYFDTRALTKNLARRDHGYRRCSAKHVDFRQYIRTTRLCAANSAHVSAWTDRAAPNNADLAQQATFSARTDRVATWSTRADAARNADTRQSLGTIHTKPTRRISRKLCGRFVLAARRCRRVGTFIGRSETTRDGISREVGFRSQRTQT